MQDILVKLTPFMQRANGAKLTAKLSMAEEHIYDLLVDDKEEAVGIIQLLADDRLKIFGAFSEEEEPEETMMKEEICVITKSFIKKLFPESVSILHLDSISDFRGMNFNNGECIDRGIDRV